MAKDAYLPEDREAGRQMELQVVRRARQELADGGLGDHWWENREHPRMIFWLFNVAFEHHVF